MQASEGLSSPSAIVSLRSSSVQAPVVQPVPASQQRALTVGPKGLLPIQAPAAPRLQQVQAVLHHHHHHHHPFPAQIQFLEEGEAALYPNGTIASEGPAFAQPPPGSAPFFFQPQGGRRGASPSPSPSSSSQLETTMESLQKSPGLALPPRKSSALNSHLQWLLDNYEAAEGVSLPRSALYGHYLRHCQDQRMPSMEPLNAASFGKLIRSVFLGLRTRRLGTRGNSKYHYYGIRLKPGSPLSRRLQQEEEAEEPQPSALRQQQQKQHPKCRPVSQKPDGDTEDVASQSQHHQQFIDVTRVLPEFPTLDLEALGLSDVVQPNDAKALEILYRRHCEANVDVVKSLQFAYIEKLWQSFWNSEALSSDDDDATSLPFLPRSRLIALCRLGPVASWMRSCDRLLFQTLLETLVPDVLRPVPGTLTQSIRNFAKGLEGLLANAMNDFPQQIVQTKLGVVSAFAQTLRRYTSLNHLAQAARAVLQNPSQTSQMLSDLNRVDFANVQEQAGWVCQCPEEEEGLVQRLERDFKRALQQQSSLEQWAQWLERALDQALGPHQGGPHLPTAARHFLLQWSFYSSMVIRDLTLRSAASFGSFHLIRLLYDEYMFYLVEHCVARAAGETPIALMAEVGDLTSMSTHLLEKDDLEPPVKRERNEDDPELSL
nr:DNA-binding protein RFX2-like [Anolis sagrei ordinatus]